MMRAFGTMLGLIYAAASQAQTPIVVDVRNCVGMLKDETRLECYDKQAAGEARKLQVAGKSVPALMAPALYRDPTSAQPSVASSAIPPAKPAPSDDVGKWRPWREADSFDGKTIVSASVSATTTTLSPQRRPAVTTKRAELYVICHKGQTRVYVTLDRELVASHRVLVDYRLDEQAPVLRQRWSASTDSTAVGFWGGGAAAFTKKLASAKRLRIRTAHDVFGELEADFDITGARAAIVPVAKECEWAV